MHNWKCGVSCGPEGPGERGWGGRAPLYRIVGQGLVNKAHLSRDLNKVSRRELCMCLGKEYSGWGEPVQMPQEGWRAGSISEEQ